MDVPWFDWWMHRRTGKGGARSPSFGSAQEAGDRVDQQADEPADERAVDPDKLQVPSHRQLESPRGRLSIPARHRLGDQVADLVAILFDDPRRDLDQQIVDLGEERGIRQQGDAEFGEAAVEWA